ncbi:MAG: hypothetical protein E7011_03090 [Alphaproteobacteria bacterium]|nr:hypothetical protein [Alphaproteobacteria bacterium]
MIHMKILMFVLVLGTCTSNAFADCADGYSIIDDSGLCKTVCEAGYFVSTAGQPCKQIPDSIGAYYSETHTVVYGEQSGNNLKRCPSSPACIGIIDYPSNAKIGAHDSITKCYCSKILTRISVWPYKPPSENYNGARLTNSHGTGYTACYYISGTDGNAVYGPESLNGQGCINGLQLVTCDAGFYDVRNGKWVAGYVPYQSCQPVGYGYWSPDGDLARYPCPAGTQTCGYGNCADDISDCVATRTLYAGTDVAITLYPYKNTTPALNIKTSDDNRVWYADMTTRIQNGTLQIKTDNDVQYSVVNPLDKFYKYTGSSLYGDTNMEIFVLPNM